MEKPVKMNFTFFWFPWNAEVADLVSHFRRSLELEHRAVEEGCVGSCLEGLRPRTRWAAALTPGLSCVQFSLLLSLWPYGD